MPFHTVYGVSDSEVSRFVEDNEAVDEWLGKYRGRTIHENSYKLCRFFKWLRIIKDQNFSPKDLLNDQIQLRRSDDIEDRRRHLRWALEHTRDNPDFQDLSDNWKYSLFLVIKSFYDYHEVPLTAAKNVFGKRRKRKNNRKQITLAQAKKIISLVNQRERAILLIILQSGMEIGAVLNKMNFMWDQIIPQIEAGRPRVKVEFAERKGNNYSYFTYFSDDAVQELKKWLLIRQRIVNKKGEPSSHPIFITREATPYLENNYYQTIDYHRAKKKLPNFVTHQFRKLFKTEASLPERGIDRNVIEFFMGHVNELASMGGTYDKTPEIHEDVIEKEYAKLEPYLNIYSGAVIAQQERDIEIEKLKTKVNELMEYRELEDQILGRVESQMLIAGGREFYDKITKNVFKVLTEMQSEREEKKKVTP